MTSHRLLSAFLLLAASTASSFVLSDDPGSCGSHVQSDHQHAIRAQFALDRRASLVPRAAVPDCGNAEPAAAKLNLHWHVIYANETYDGGFLSDKQIADQMTFLNSEWGKFIPGLQIALVNTTRTKNEDGFIYAREKVSDIRTGIVTSLHTGGALDINVYSVSFTYVPDLRGFSSFPWDFKNDTVNDGIFLKWNSLPGGSLKSNGGSLVHEVGHWLGLYHTWQDGCQSPNDEVDDTPAEDPINANRGLQTCPASFDSCPDMPGQDPIHNYMTYAGDDCRTEFTKGQVARVLEQSGTYRSLAFACPSNEKGNGDNSSGVSVRSNSGSSSAPASSPSNDADQGNKNQTTGSSGGLGLFPSTLSGFVASVAVIAGCIKFS
ncbi:hypothetical protein R3P38DRAFT_2517209 [Favolaschia claudopus]|uniref:Peptidase M43 pregnancy-associated plasma-A domain-containing protein n=1 Tax=Favolaschia claudopus TaxID=2862362 RepID=A0AAW0CDS1_9AGAR